MAGAHVIEDAGPGETSAARLGRAATYTDLDAVPENLVAAILDGELVWPLDRPLGFEESPQALFHGDR